eukprot:5901247-Pyramimonas_sp.AAC.1
MGNGHSALEAEWATTKIPLPRDETLFKEGLEPLFHHVVRRRPTRLADMQASDDQPLEELQVAAQTALDANVSGCTWRAKEASDS